MSRHAPHPDTSKHGLSDTCIECVAAIADPLRLPSTELARIWTGTIHTKTDLKVFDTINRAAVLTQRLEHAVGSDGATGVFQHRGAV